MTLKIKSPERNSLANLACDYDFLALTLIRKCKINFEIIRAKFSFTIFQVYPGLSKWSICCELSVNKEISFGAFWTSTLDLDRLLKNDHHKRRD